MPIISEKWEIQVGKNKHILTGKEKDLLVMAGEKGIKFVVIRDLVINPAFVMDMVLIERVNEQQIEAPVEKELTEEEREINIKRIKQMRQKLKANAYV